MNFSSPGIFNSLLATRAVSSETGLCRLVKTGHVPSSAITGKTTVSGCSTFAAEKVATLSSGDKWPISEPGLDLLFERASQAALTFTQSEKKGIQGEARFFSGPSYPYDEEAPRPGHMWLRRCRLARIPCLQKYYRPLSSRGTVPPWGPLGRHNR